MTYLGAQIRIGAWAALCVLVAACGLRACGPTPVHAQAIRPIPMSQWDELAGVALARMVRHESHSATDADAIAWTMARRWYAHACARGVRFAEHVIATSRFLRRDRAEIYAHAADMKRRDETLRDRLDAWARGDVPDPCEWSSFQWRSPDTRVRLRRVSCGTTSNRFYAHPEPGHGRALLAVARGREVCR